MLSGSSPKDLIYLGSSSILDKPMGMTSTVCSADSGEIFQSSTTNLQHLLAFEKHHCLTPKHLKPKTPFHHTSSGSLQPQPVDPSKQTSEEVQGESLSSLKACRRTRFLRLAASEEWLPGSCQNQEVPLKDNAPEGNFEEKPHPKMWFLLALIYDRSFLPTGGCKGLIENQHLLANGQEVKGLESKE